MQNVHARAGARGWPWRVEQIERMNPAGGSGAPRQAAVLRLAASRDDAGRAALLAVAPFEPLASLPTHDTLEPVPAAVAAGVVAAAQRAERLALAVRAAGRLQGDIHPWQLAAAIAFERGHARVLVADETGMGKTVSAAIAIAQCLDEGIDRRCLVLAPAHLLSQWRAELHARLAIDAQILDAAALGRAAHALPAGLSAWALPGCTLASFDFIKQPHIVRSLETRVWDLVAVDEAHIACGASERRGAVAAVARRARRVLLLTATPSDGGDDRLRALLALGAAEGSAPPIYLRHVAAGRRRVERDLTIAPGRDERALHELLSQYVAWIAGGHAKDEPVRLLGAVLTKRALSSPHAIRLSLLRRRAALARGAIDVQPALFDPEDDAGVIGAATGRPRGLEHARIDALIDRAARAEAGDRRLRALTALIRRTRESAIVFTCFRDTARIVAARLSPIARVRLVHGGLPQAAIDAALAAFRYGRARVLVATDVASQGLNLHHGCRWVIHYDLPWRPPVIRQRTGRVDRLGQTRTVHATSIVARGELSAVMRERLGRLTARMRDDERAGARRWDILAAAEARRLDAARGTEETGAPDTAPLPATVIETEWIDAAGAVAERRVTAFGALEEASHARARACAQRRRRWLRRVLAARSARRISREAAVLAAALEPARALLRQDGLFERRADRARAAGAAARERLRREAESAVACHRDAARIVAARSRTIAVVTRGHTA